MRNIDANFARPAPPERLDGIEQCMQSAEAAKEIVVYEKECRPAGRPAISATRPSTGRTQRLLP